MRKGTGMRRFDWATFLKEEEEKSLAAMQDPRHAEKETALAVAETLAMFDRIGEQAKVREERERREKKEKEARAAEAERKRLAGILSCTLPDGTVVEYTKKVTYRGKKEMVDTFTHHNVHGYRVEKARFTRRTDFDITISGKTWSCRLYEHSVSGWGLFGYTTDYHSPDDHKFSDLKFLIQYLLKQE